ncbi:MAG: hypothetical protein ACYC9Q_11855 [Bacillota bacterium]
MASWRLFEPGNIGTCGLKNRIVMAPLGTSRVAGVWEAVTAANEVARFI